VRKADYREVRCMPDYDALTLTRLIFQLADAVEEGRVERSIPLPNVSAEPAGEIFPSLIVTSVAPAVGSTVVDFPVPQSILWGEKRPQRQPFKIIEGFEIKVKGKQVTVGKGKYAKYGEEREFGGAQLTFSEPCLLVFNIETEQVELVKYRTPRHWLLKVLTFEGVQDNINNEGL